MRNHSSYKVEVIVSPKELTQNLLGTKSPFLCVSILHFLPQVSSVCKAWVDVPQQSNFKGKSLFICKMQMPGGSETENSEAVSPMKFVQDKECLRLKKF